MKRSIFSIIVYFLLILGASVFGKEKTGSGYVYTLKTYIQEALRKSYELRAVHLDVAIAEANKKLTLNYYIPTHTAIPGIRYNRFLTETSASTIDTLDA